MPPHVYVTVWEDFQNTAQTYTQSKKQGGTIILVVVLLLLPVPCPGDAVFRCESTVFGLPKEDNRNQCLSCIYNTVLEQYNPEVGASHTRSSLKSLKSSQWLTSSKSSRVLIRVKSSHSLKQEQIYFCHTTLFIFPQKLILIIHFK